MSTLDRSSRLGAFVGQDERIDAAFSTIHNRGGSILNIHRTLCHSPAMLRAQASYATALRGESSIPRPLQQLAILRVCQLNRGEYEWNVHSSKATKEGVPAEKIDELQHWASSDQFTAEEKVMLTFVDAASANQGIDDIIFRTAQNTFGAAGVVDLASLVAWYVGNTRFTHALEIALDDSALPPPSSAASQSRSAEQQVAPSASARNRTVSGVNGRMEESRMKIPCRDTARSYGSVSIGLHWVTALLVLSLILTAIVMFVWLPNGHAPDLPTPLGTLNRLLIILIHEALGMVLLPIAVCRIVWRLRSGKPESPKQSKPLMTLAAATWRVLLIGLAVQIVSGPLSVLTYGYPLQIFNLVVLKLPFLKSASGHALVETVHHAAGWVILGTVTLHICGALFHTLIKQDGTLTRMIIPGRRLKAPSDN
ncbi:cytochrome b/b6 domain-containing protein [Burkholderia cenocepacia]|uniref:cytochrome b/b6 domain-containing protein n=1 Tax=Burkholderia cenocepacia TaxID=95486 RepID=UPI0028548492|nr:cytochrome b/b6 domain-containing protein [Burkholderia cenocepacia]MDR8104994.1 cytochrome b/b6 domain-containing protein [Burkholderia cenocepacia]